MRKKTVIDEEIFLQLYSTPCTYERQIDLDIERTLRNHILFRIRFGSGQRSLFKMLVALANLYPDIGYCQGMSSVAAFLLLYFDEYSAFNHLVTLFEAQDLLRLYDHFFPKLFETFYIQEQLMKHLHTFRHITRHLDSLHIGVPIYGTKWYLTLFLGLPYTLSARIWDLFLFYGFDILIFASLALVKYFERDILRSDYEGAMETLSRCEERRIDPDKFVKLLKHIRDLATNDEQMHIDHIRRQFKTGGSYIHHDNSTVS